MRNLRNPLLTTMTVAAVIGAGSFAKADETGPVPPATAAPANAMPAQVSSGHGGFGVGVIIGEPTGFSAKYWLSDLTAVDLGAAWSFEDEDSFHLHGDFLLHKFDLFPVDQGELPVYFGVGGRVKFVEHGDNRAGVRVPVGIAYLFPRAPVEIFAEAAPIIDVAPSTTLRFNGGIGVRYYFR